MTQKHDKADVVADVVVVGGGPAGASAACRLARAGIDVAVVEKKRYPREKTCGDGLTPRSVKALWDLGMREEVSRYHQVRGLRAYCGDRMLELDWPDHPVFPRYGCVVTRAELDNALADRAKKEGVVFFEETEAIEPVLDDGVMRKVRCRTKQGEDFSLSSNFVVMADGSLSRFGRRLGNQRQKRYPLGMAIRGYYKSARHNDDFIESHLSIRDAQGAALPGYGWVFPEGDGSINVGIGLLSTFRHWKDVNTSHLMDAFSRVLPDYWGVDPDAGWSIRGGKLPMGMSVRPRVGPNWVVLGDAVGAVNPFNGEGIAYALETAELASDLLVHAVRNDNGAVLQRYPEVLDDVYGSYYRTARLFVRLIGEPRLMDVLARVGMRSQRLMEAVLRIMANLITPGLRDPEEKVYKLVEKVVAIGPEP